MNKPLLYLMIGLMPSLLFSANLVDFQKEDWQKLNIAPYDVMLRALHSMEYPESYLKNSQTNPEGVVFYQKYLKDYKDNSYEVENEKLGIERIILELTKESNIVPLLVRLEASVRSRLKTRYINQFPIEPKHVIDPEIRRTILLFMVSAVMDVLKEYEKKLSGIVNLTDVFGSNHDHPISTFFFLKYLINDFIPIVSDNKLDQVHGVFTHRIQQAILMLDTLDNADLYGHFTPIKFMERIISIKHKNPKVAKWENIFDGNVKYGLNPLSLNKLMKLHTPILHLVNQYCMDRPFTVSELKRLYPEQLSVLTKEPDVPGESVERKKIRILSRPFCSCLHETAKSIGKTLDYETFRRIHKI